MRPKDFHFHDLPHYQVQAWFVFYPTDTGAASISPSAAAHVHVFIPIAVLIVVLIIVFVNDIVLEFVGTLSLIVAHLVRLVILVVTFPILHLHGTRETEGLSQRVEC